MDDKALRLAEFFANQLHNIDVFHLIVTTNIVDLADSAFVDNQVNGTAVILNIQPITYIQSLAVNWERFVSQRIYDHQWNELLWEVV